jgi:type VI secretion system protein ImpC
MMRDKIGSFMSRQEAQIFLNRWISKYVLENDVAPASQKAKYPLREARVDVTEVPGQTGAYRAVAFLRPHFQFGRAVVSLRLVADLPPPAK